MTSLKQKFNSLGFNRKQVVNIRTLITQHQYPVNNIKKTDTKYGQRLLVELDQFKVFLPERYLQVFSDEEIVEINNSILKKTEHFFLVSKGELNGVLNFELV